MKMKKLKLIAAVLTAIIAMSALLTGCAYSPARKNDAGDYTNGLLGDVGGSYPTAPGVGSGGYGDGYTDKGYLGAPEDGEAGSSGGYDGGDKPDGSADTVITQRPAGLITASAWNDNDYYGYWLTQLACDGAAGKLYPYTQRGWGLYSQSRVKVTVTAGGAPAVNARVTAFDGTGHPTFTAVTDANGVAYLFPQELAGGTVMVRTADTEASRGFTATERELTLELDNAPEKSDLIIEIMYVVDVTGSMGDELTYLKNELADVVERVRNENPQSAIRLALLFYRDKNDSVSLDYYDFRDVTTADGLAAQQAAIDGQYATGGGDTPEMVDEALLLAVEKAWSENSTKIIFQVLDAPPHSESSDKQGFSSAVMIAAEKGIRICPIICSGADGLTEWLMREAAIQTGGTFVFVTDDSGIGGAHHDPELPNTVVEALNLLMVRLINGYHTGSFAPPVSWKGGN